MIAEVVEVSSYMSNDRNVHKEVPQAANVVEYDKKS